MIDRRVAHTDYYVMLFYREDESLVGSARIKMDSMIAAIGEAQHRAQAAVGAIAFGLSDTPENQELEILFRTGDVPDDTPNALSG
jgi:hypothetical protein